MTSMSPTCGTPGRRTAGVWRGAIHRRTASWITCARRRRTNRDCRTRSPSSSSASSTTSPARFFRYSNTCYLPNQPTPRRCVALGEAIASAVTEWTEPATVAIVASGGLSHFVVDEELDRTLLGALERNDLAALGSIPRHRLHSAGSEARNWVTLGGAMHRVNLKMELLDYVPVYRTPAATGGGWAFVRWR